MPNIPKFTYQNNPLLNIKPTPVVTAPKPTPAPTPVAKPVVRATPAPTPAPAPVAPAPAPAPATPATVYGADLPTYSATDEMDTALSTLANKAKTDMNMTVSPEKTYQEKLKMYQAEIDAVNQLYRQKINEAKIEGQGRLGTGRAIQGRSGLLGSDFAAAQNDTITTSNNEIVDGKRAEQQAEIERILGLARKDATDEIATKNAAKEKGAESYLKYLGEQSTRRSSKLESLIASIGETDISTISPTNLAEVAKSYGLSADELKTKVKEAQKAATDKAKEAELKTNKTQAEIDKLYADIDAGKWQSIGEGTMLRNIETGETIKNPKTATPGSGGGSGAGGGIYSQLDYRTANAVIAQGNKFGETPIVKTYNNLVGAANLIGGVDSKSKNPADHQAIIYNFAKMLDPDSVVREGEYATIQKYSQSLASKYRGQINQAANGTGFLSEQAIKDIQSATNNRIQSYTPQYTNARNQAAQRINSIAGQDIADQVLLDFEGGYQAPEDDISTMSDEDLLKYASQ